MDWSQLSTSIEGKYSQLTLEGLKAELRKRCSKISGRKADLIHRLEVYDANISEKENLTPEYQMELPEKQNYKDINSTCDIPKISRRCINNFANAVEKLALSKSGDMYKEKYLLAIRSATGNDSTFIKSFCAAEMRKHVVYEVDVEVNKNCIIQAQCECAAGIGPTAHCKHVFVCLFALEDYSINKSIVVQESSTNTLQSFHHPKRYFGSPKKARDLAIKKCNQDILKFDPRPASARNNPNYAGFFRNACVNFAASNLSPSPMPILQTIEPANIPAVFLDHCYCVQVNHEEKLLSDQELAVLEENTRGQRNNKLWIQERCLRLQSSNFGRICKCTERTDKKKLEESLLCTKQIHSKALDHGVFYEKKALAAFQRRTTKQVKECGLFVNKSDQFLGSSPDGIVVGENALLEIKCPYTAKGREISPETVPYIYLCEDTGTYKLYEHHDYYYQIQGQLYCSGRDLCYLIIFTLKDILIINVERNQGFIMKMTLKLTTYYNDYFKQAIIEKFKYKDYIKHLVT